MESFEINIEIFDEQFSTQINFNAILILEIWNLLSWKFEPLFKPR